MIKKIMVIICFLFFLPFMVGAEELNFDWQKSWGGNRIDQISSMVTTKNGETVVIGNSNSTDIDGIEESVYPDSIITKYDKEGNVIWQNVFGNEKNDGFSEILLTEDNSFIVVGVSNITGVGEIINKGDNDAIIIKYDQDGNMLWAKNWGGTKYDIFRSVLVTSDGGFIVAGSSYMTGVEGLTGYGNEDAVLVKYDKDGNMLWQKNWGGNSSDYFKLMLSVENEIIIIGATNSTDIEENPSNGGYDAVIFKYDQDGNMLGKKSFGGSGNDYISSIIQTKDAEFIAVGQSNSTDIEGLSNKGKSDAIMIKFDKKWNIVWQNNWGGTGAEQFSGILQTRDAGFIAVGHSNSTDIEKLPNRGKNDVVMIKYDKNGNMMWQESFGGSNDDRFDYASLMENIHFIIAARTNSTDIEGLENKGGYDAIVRIYSIKYSLQNIVTKNGTSISKQQGSLGIITPTPNEGYEVDEIIIKDTNGNILDVELTALEDGTYSFPLYTDVSVEVLFKEVLSNPKTGVLDYISFILVGLLINFVGYVSINYNNKKFEL